MNNINEIAEESVKLKSISHSEISTHYSCHWKHKISYIDKPIEKETTQYTGFGIALHAVVENKHKQTDNRTDSEIFEDHLKNEFEKIKLKTLLTKKEKEEQWFDESKLKQRKTKLFEEMIKHGNKLLPELFKEMINKFGNYKILSVEEKLEYPLEHLGYPKNKFKGYIDLVIELEDGTVAIIDIKTTSWGWDVHKKTDKLTTYQLAYYKHFYSLIHNKDISGIKTYFCLLKRTAKPESCIEIFESPVGKVKINNSIELMQETLRLIDKKIYIKNRKSCTNQKIGFDCPFYKTEWCQ